MRIRRGPATVTGERTPPTATGARPEGRGERRSGSQDTAPHAAHPPARRGSGRKAPPMRRSCCCPRRTPTCSRARASGADYRLGQPGPASPDELPALLDGADLVVVRILGGRRRVAGRARRRAAPAGVPVVVLGGEQAPDAELMELSTVPAGRRRRGAHLPRRRAARPTCAQLHALPLRHACCSPARASTPPVDAADVGRAAERGRAGDDDGPTVARPLLPGARSWPGNTAFVEALCRRDRGRRRRGRCRSSAPRCARPSPTLLRPLAHAPTPWSSPCSPPAAPSPPTRQRRRRRRGWDVGALAALDVPILQGAVPDQQPRARGRPATTGCRRSTSPPRSRSPSSTAGIITVPFSFKEIDADGLPVYVADPERCARVAGIAVAHARLRHIPTAGQARSRSMLSAYPTKHARIGNAVGLDTPGQRRRAAARDARRRLRPVGDAARRRPRSDGDALIHALIERRRPGPGLAHRGPARAATRCGSPPTTTATGSPTLPAELRATPIEEHWGPPPGELFVDEPTDGDIVLAALRVGQRAC